MPKFKSLIYAISISTLLYHKFESSYFINIWANLTNELLRNGHRDISMQTKHASRKNTTGNKNSSDKVGKIEGTERTCALNRKAARNDRNIARWNPSGCGMCVIRETERDPRTVVAIRWCKNSENIGIDPLNPLRRRVGSRFLCKRALNRASAFLSLRSAELFNSRRTWVVV